MASRLKKGGIVREVRNNKTGEVFDGDDYLKGYYLNIKSEQKIFNNRYEEEYSFQNNNKYFVCALCGGAVSLRGGGENVRIHFYHRDTKESKFCPIHKGYEILSKEQIRAIIYDGVRESEAHKNLCHMLYNLILNNGNCSSVYKNSVLKLAQNVRKFRPDVQAICYGKNIAFEIQLSPDFLTTIVAREQFYIEHRTYLLWIFNTFNNNNFFEKDIFYNNNCNAFVFSEKEYALSIEKKQIIFTCWYWRPRLDKRYNIIDEYYSKIISIDEIIFCDNFKCYFYDSLTRLNKLNAIIKKALPLKNNHIKTKEARKLFKTTVVHLKKDIYNFEYNPYKILCDKLACISKEFSSDHVIKSWRSTDILNIMRATFSAIEDQPMGYNFENIKQVFNEIECKHKNIFLYFAYVYKIKGHTIKSDIPKWGKRSIAKKIYDAENDIKKNLKSPFLMTPEQISIVKYLFRDIFCQMWRDKVVFLKLIDITTP